MVVSIDGSIIRHRICPRALNAIQQTVVNCIATLSLCLIHSKPHEIVAKALDSFPRKDAENISLRVCKLGRSIATESG